ncbi:MAG: fluoride efflux transporter CrcB [Solirubrobacteraceae bacterium]
MSVAVLLGVGVLGGVGALARFLLDGSVAARLGRSFPFGTLAVNLSGTFLLAVLVGAAVDGDALRLAGTGLLAAFTTFSTWALESQRLGEDGQPGLGLLNFAASLVFGLLLAWAGQHLGALL